MRNGHLRSSVRGGAAALAATAGLVAGCGVSGKPSSSAPPHPVSHSPTARVEIVKRRAQGGQIKFDRFSVPVSPTRPAGPIAISQLRSPAAVDSAARGVPRAPAGDGASAANHYLQVEPATITYTGDGSGFLGGASVRKSSIHWTEWTAQVAIGTGFDQVNTCGCASGGYRAYRVRIELWRARPLHGALVFTRMTIFYVGSRPRGEPSHYTFTDTYQGHPGSFSWGPPSAAYCTQTLGLPPAAGCQNIHSLPSAS